MLSLLKSQFTARVFAAPARIAPVAPFASQWFSTSAATFLQKKKVTKKDSKKKAKKDAVKRPSSAYMFFVKDYFQQHGEELKQIDFAARAKVLKTKYDALSHFEKSKFESLQETDTKRYEAEKALAAAHAPPKRPPTAYLTWFTQARGSIISSNPGLSFAEIGKLGGERWKQLSEQEKSSYLEDSQTKMLAWKADYAKWKESQA